MRRARHRRAMLVVPLLLLPAVAEARAERLPVKAYTIESGVPHNRVKRIVQDSHGFLWFCTAAGLSRFDGYQFVTYGIDEGLPALSLNDIVETADGEYWLATNSDGVVRFNLRPDPSRPAGSTAPRFTVYPVSREPVGNRVNVLYRDRAGTLWAGTDGGLFASSDPAAGRAFEPVPLGIPSRADIQVQVWTMVEDGAGNLWIGTKFGLIRRLRSGRMVHYAIQPTADDDQVAALVTDRSGHVWLGHRAAGLFTFNPARAADPSPADGLRPRPLDTRRYTTADGLDNNSILALHQSRDRLWIRTFGPALTEFDGHEFRTYAVGERLGDNVASLTEDRDGNFWLSTKALGALKVVRNGWTSYGEADGLGESVASVFQNAGGELFVNSTGWRVSRFDGRGFTTVRVPLPATVTDVSWRDVNGVLQDRAGEWWVATRQGIFRFPRVHRFEHLARARPIAIYTTNEGLATNDVTRLFEDSRGDIWIGSWVQAREPVVRWERATGRFHRYSQADGLRPFLSATVFQEDAAGDVWIGFREAGVVRYRAGRFTTLGPDDGLPDGSVNSIYVDPSRRVWLAIGRQGLGRIDHPDADRPGVVTYSVKDGLASNSVVHVTGDLNGRIYVVHMRGIDRLDPTTMALKHYSTGDGLPATELKMAFRDRSDVLWFCTTTGLARFAPPAVEERAPVSPILIAAVRVAGVPYPVSPLGQREVSGLRLQPGQNNVQIDFLSVGSRAGETLRYQYRLEGAAGDWSVPGPNRSVDLASLVPGTYRFTARAVDAEGAPGASTATVAFEILPAFWRRSWFQLLAGSLVASLAIAFSRSRHKRLKALRESEEVLRRSREERLAELERVRTRIATDLHDDVGSTLTRISLLSEVVRRQVTDSDPSLDGPLAGIASLSRELVSSMSDIVWAINPAKDHLSDLSRRMRTFASDVCTARHIAFRFHTPSSEDDIPVGANLRREVYLLFKEAINNLVRHSGCSEADLEFRVSRNGLSMRISDNGVGFDPLAVSGGNGLRSLHDRTAALGGRLDVVSAPGAGTTLLFAIPLGDRPISPLSDTRPPTAPHNHAGTAG